MISGIGGTGTAAASGSAQSNRTTIGKDQFLQLLVTQLQHQDPLSPLQPHEFAAQLAQFSSVEQLTQLNDAVATQIASSQLSAMIGKTALSASLLGKQIVAEGNQVVIPSGGAGQIRIEAEAAGQATVRLLDDTGKVVAERDLGAIAEGRQNLTLPSDLPAGTWHYEVTVTDSEGAAVNVATYMTGLVDGVFFRDGVIVLRMGALEVPLDSLAEIEPAPLVPAPAGAQP